MNWPCIPDLFDNDPLPSNYSTPAVVEVFSTITSPVFSEFVIVVGRRASVYLPREVWLFETLRMMSEARPFKLTFLLEVSDLYQEEGRRELVEALDSVTAKGFLDFLDSPPTIRRVPYPQQDDDMSSPDFD